VRKFFLSPLIFVAISALSANAQQSGTTAAVVASEPGAALVARTLEVSARVVAIDKTYRIVTLKGPKGDIFEVLAGDDVKNFDQIQLNDVVVARYVESLYLELKKTKAGIRERRESETAERAPLGERPSAAAAREVVILADVVAVDPKNQTVTLKGPKGNIMALPVSNPDQFKVVKKGDQVEATYTEAIALSVEAVPAGHK
jgi:hypothetical protein